MRDATQLEDRELQAAKEMAENVEEKALRFLTGEKEFLHGTFMLCTPLHAKAQKLFSVMIPALPGYMPDAPAEITTTPWLHRGLASNENSISIEDNHYSIVSIQQAIAGMNGRLVVARTTYYEVHEGDESLTRARPEMVQYLGELAE
jgi:hypothetical protein